MGDHDVIVVPVGDRWQAECVVCGWITGWRTHDDAWKLADDHLMGLPV